MKIIKKEPKKFSLVLSLLFSLFSWAELPEMVIAEERIPAGISFVFEGAIKDSVYPVTDFDQEDKSDIHIEVLANWNENAPAGSPIDGFVAYLRINALIINQRSKEENLINLLPHVNLSDNFHYALNTKLPGKRSDLYTVRFLIQPPKPGTVGIHFDWKDKVGSILPNEYSFEYRDLNFEKIANSSRR